MAGIYINLIYVFILAAACQRSDTKWERIGGHALGSFTMLSLWVCIYGWLIDYCPPFPSHPLSMILEQP